MISTALAIQNATGEAVTDFSTMLKAKSIFNNRGIMSDSEFTEALFEYSAHLSSLTATLVTHACFTETQMDELISTINEMEAMGKDVE
jgi:hypothetical protein